MSCRTSKFLLFNPFDTSVMRNLLFRLRKFDAVDMRIASGTDASIDLALFVLISNGKSGISMGLHGL